MCKINAKSPYFAISIAVFFMLPVPALLFNVGQGRFTSYAAKLQKKIMKNAGALAHIKKK